MNRRLTHSQRGFSLLESLIALVVMAFGLLAIAGIGLKLATSEDVARQRGEAARLAQEKIEEFRSFTQIDTAAGVNAWESMGSGGSSDVIANGADYHANTQFNRSWQVLDSADDPWRRVRVTVNWADRVGGATVPNTLSFSTIISKTDPFDSGSLAFPLPGNTTLKRPKNRNLNIPVPAVDLGGGKSVVQLASNFAVVFSNDSGYVVLTCNFVVDSIDDLSNCTETSAYIIAGYISLSGTTSFPSGLLVSTAQLSGTSGVTCTLANAVDQNTGTAISGYKYYLCVVSVPSPGAAWAGTVRLGGSGLNSGATGYKVCRFEYPGGNGATNNQRNMQPYGQVAESLDNQNYVLSTSHGDCPTISSLATVEHQNCRGSNPNSNPSRATDCPVN
ncbi:prepilin-type N-terminal cleavage/methylation domain-containing protein [Aquincola sp. S2]|uniref:Prepilin-type N-terminal cleavage/methylation domain-containing protein n=1 Tax=Pseudaquabacterium terrae TaxID=2732868 RepID=A0ABX2EUK6_9BURK|nr:prepilin-type N-terminal cleavage/methylation domain-containing protein [Aquabacterium terrae]NRF72327.1 prepilin-type N-terminal cleavage/methylation domain-containing protein [Aquabacterium terrae]